MATKRQVIALPDCRKPVSNQSISNWYNAKIGSSSFSKDERTHIVGGFTSTNGQYQSESINSGGSGSIYSSGGFVSSVQTKTSTVFSTLHYIGPTNGLSFSGSNLNGLTMGAVFSTSASANFTRNVVGFWCQVNGQPTGSGSEADGCGNVQSYRISAVYMDQGRGLRVMEMCEKGLKLGGHTWNTSASTSANNWENMIYSLQVSDNQRVINDEYMHIGWIINLTHEKTCGGGNKQKNCTGRVRYLTPLVSSAGDGGLFTGVPTRHQVIYPYTTWSNYHGLASDKYGIYTI